MAAREALVDLIPEGSRVTLVHDVQHRDRYGRTLAYVYLEDGRMANLEMARMGFVTALVYPPNVRHADTIRAAIAEARTEGRGLWAQVGFACEPRDFRAKRC